LTPENISSQAQVKIEPKASSDKKSLSGDKIGKNKSSLAIAQTIIGKFGFCAITIFPDLS
jgi:hypothetical protein